MQRIRNINWSEVRIGLVSLFAKLVRTRKPSPPEVHPDGRPKFTRCLSTDDLTSLGVGSCAGTGMYLVAGLVAHKFAGPAVIFSFIIAAIASLFSGACYAEFGVRVPYTTGSAYMYGYVTVGEFVAFIIGWNMILEYLIGTCACARALSASIDSLCGGRISSEIAERVGTIYGKPPDLLAGLICILMMLVLMAGVKKSIVFTNILNAINISVWVFFMTAGLFYADGKNWTMHGGFLPFGWTGVFSGAATCFYAFIGFDVIATTGQEANNPKRSIPASIIISLLIVLFLYITSSIILTLVVPYDLIDPEAGLVQMFMYVHAPICKYIVGLGALSGLTVSMFGSMFPMPRVIFAMAEDGLVFKRLAFVSDTTGAPTTATLLGGICAALISTVVQLEILVEMMSIGSLLAYTMVSSCVFTLRYQPFLTNLIELLPQQFHTPGIEASSSAEQHETAFIDGFAAGAQGSNRRVMVRRVTRSSPDSDDSFPEDESDCGRDDTFLITDQPENKFYATAGPGVSSSRYTALDRICDAIYYKFHSYSYLCPALFPWVNPGPPTEATGIFVVKSYALLFVLIIIFDILAVYGSPAQSGWTLAIMILLFLATFILLLIISRQPQNRVNLMYATPGVPFVPGIGVAINFYLMLNLNELTMLRFAVWMAIGLVVYFRYGIKNSILENPPMPPPALPPAPTHKPTFMDRITIPPAPPKTIDPHHRNIFEGERPYNYNKDMYGDDEFCDPLSAWDRAEKPTLQVSSVTFKQVEHRFDEKTNSTTSHATSSRGRPPWAEVNQPFPSWDD